MAVKSCYGTCHTNKIATLGFNSTCLCLCVLGWVMGVLCDCDAFSASKVFQLHFSISTFFKNFMLLTCASEGWTGVGSTVSRISFCKYNALLKDQLYDNSSVF